MTFPKTALKTIGGGKGGGPSYPSLQRSACIGIFQYIYFPGNPNNHFFKDGNGETTICYAKIGFAIQLKQPFINGCSRFQVYIEVFRDMWVWQQKTQKLSEDIWGYVTYTPWGTRVLQHLCSPLSSVFIPSNIRICHTTWATKQTLLLSIILVVFNSSDPYNGSLRYSPSITR